MELMCNFSLVKSNIETKYDISFDEYFADALERLPSFEEDGLVHLEDDQIIVTSRGRLLIRNIAMNFDAHYNGRSDNGPQYSRTV